MNASATDCTLCQSGGVGYSPFSSPPWICLSEGCFKGLPRSTASAAWCRGGQGATCKSHLNHQTRTGGCAQPGALPRIAHPWVRPSAREIFRRRVKALQTTAETKLGRGASGLELSPGPPPPPRRTNSTNWPLASFLLSFPCEK
jgi:hypothetical protein